MPLYASGFFVPTSIGIPYILEDIYVRGGYRAASTLEERNAIKPASRKVGMMCYVREDSRLYWIPGPATAGDAAWKEFDATSYVHFKWNAPLSMEKNEETGEYNVNIDNKRIVPVVSQEEAGWILTADAELGPVWKKLEALPNRDNAETGQALILDANGQPIWGAIEALPPTANVPLGSSIVLTENGPAWGEAQKSGRIEIAVGMESIIVAGTAQKEADIQCNSAMILRLAVSHPDMYVEIHSTNAFNDTNPYSFLSSSIKLEDDGVTILEDGTEVRNRRYGFFSNPNLGERKMYIRVENRSQESAEVIVNLTLLPLE